MLVWIYRFRIGRPYLLNYQYLAVSFFTRGVIQIVDWYVLIAVVSQCDCNFVFVTYEEALILRVMKIHGLEFIDVSFLSYVEI